MVEIIHAKRGVWVAINEARPRFAIIAPTEFAARMKAARALRLHRKLSAALAKQEPR